MKKKNSFWPTLVMMGFAFLLGAALTNPGSSARAQLPRPGENVKEHLRDMPPAKSEFGAYGLIAYSVHNVVPGSPAEKLGLRKGDLITEWNGRQILSARDLLLITSLDPGQPVEVKYVRPNFTSGQWETFQGTTYMAPIKDDRPPGR